MRERGKEGRKVGEREAAGWSLYNPSLNSLLYRVGIWNQLFLVFFFFFFFLLFGLQDLNFGFCGLCDLESLVGGPRNFGTRIAVVSSLEVLVVYFGKQFSSEQQESVQEEEEEGFGIGF